MAFIAPICLLCVLLVLLSRRLQTKLRALFVRRPALVFAVAVALAAVFCATAASVHALSLPLALAVFGYMMIPAACVYWSRADFAMILMLWLPLEWGVGASLVPRRAQGVLHATAYAIALLLAVTLFLLVRRSDGMRYRLPRKVSDLRNVAIGYLVSAAVLIPLGLRIGFLAHPHLAHLSAGGAFGRFVLIFFATAFPEEILFRSLIQNWLTRRLTHSWQAVAIAGVIFGAAHLDNGPGALPNWRYMAEATIAGWIFGAVFVRSSSVLASAAVHAAVDLTQHLFF
ncbi:MAG TPA: CPBP family intramembrane glutamic endopeptidase [Bryobacteraceae bacterium]